ncbi:hypothetical protein EI94DRAFT_1099044 [Lactarius quietus]|nr:hypothetical protein EI94DRAFT_1099044 [Lactarius quietus]
MAMAAGSTKVTLLGNMRERPRLVSPSQRRYLLSIYLLSHSAYAHSPSRPCRRLITLCRRFQHTTSSLHLAEHDVMYVSIFHLFLCFLTFRAWYSAKDGLCSMFVLTQCQTCEPHQCGFHLSSPNVLLVRLCPLWRHVPARQVLVRVLHSNPAAQHIGLDVCESPAAILPAAPGTHWGVRNFINDGKVKDGGDWDELTLFLA